MLSTYSSYNVDMTELKEEDDAHAEEDNRCGSSAYNIMQSQSQLQVKRFATRVKYGSA